MILEPPLNLRSTYLPFGQPNFSNEEIAAVARVLQSGWIGMGPETQTFESELGTFLQATHVVTVSSCTAAMFLALLDHTVGPGDEVICPSLTWCSTANVVLHLGAKPVFCDVDPLSFCITAEAIRSKLSARTKAVMVVHLGGLTADTATIRKILPAGVALIEDAAHALGAVNRDGLKVGSGESVACFSFYANKNLSTGEGGAIALSSEESANRIRSLRQHGLPVDAWKRFTNPKALIVSTLERLGYKMNFTDLQAAIGRVQLRRQSEFHALRLQIARYYVESLKELPVIFQKDILAEGHSRHLFLVSLPVERMKITRDEFVLSMREQNIGASVHYAPLHKMPLYGVQDTCALPETEQICDRIITLPISARMSMEDACYTVHAFTRTLLGSLGK